MRRRVAFEVCLVQTSLVAQVFNLKWKMLFSKTQVAQIMHFVILILLSNH